MEKAYLLVHRTIGCILLLGLWMASRAEILRLPECGKFDMDASIQHRDKVIIGSNLEFYANMGYPECHLACIQHLLCKSINYNPSLGCQLSSKDTSNSNVTLMDKKGWTFIETPINSSNIGRVCRHRRPCRNDGICRDTCSSPGYVCMCKGKFNGKQCENVTDWGILLKNQSTNEAFYPKVEIPKSQLRLGLTACLWYETQITRNNFLLHLHPINETSLSDGDCNVLRMLGRVDRLDIYLTQNPVASLFNLNKGWKHMCFVVSTLESGIESHNIYSQGKLVSSSSISKGWYSLTKSYRILIGNDLDRRGNTCVVNDANQGFIGKVSQVHLWSFRLSEAEIQDAYNFRPEIFNRAFVQWDDFLKTFQYNNNMVDIFKFQRNTDLDDIKDIGD